MIVVLLGAVVFGSGSALVPVLNSEAYLGLAATRISSVGLLVCVGGLAMGQTMGKTVIFEVSNRGFSRVHRIRGKREGSRLMPAWLARVASDLMELLRQRRHGSAVVLVSATLGIPPLAAVSIAAGKAGTPRAAFVLSCLVGRILRFAVIAWPLLMVTG